MVLNLRSIYFKIIQSMRSIWKDQQDNYLKGILFMLRCYQIQQEVNKTFVSLNVISRRNWNGKFERDDKEKLIH